MTNVLCVSRSALTEQGVPNTGHGLYRFNLGKVSHGNFSFLERAIVDDKAVGENSRLGIANPQVLGYIVVRHGDEVLTYARKHSPNEQRLLGSRSLGFGGHADWNESWHYQDDAVNFVMGEAVRELAEELNLNCEYAKQLTELGRVIIDMRENSDPAKKGQVPVGQVHMGYVLELWVPSKDVVEETKEAQDLKWVTLDSELTKDHDLYESWSQILMDEYLMKLSEGA